jgi:hypothetical protein
MIFPSSIFFIGDFSSNTYQSQRDTTPKLEKKGNKYVKFAQLQDKYFTIHKGGHLGMITIAIKWHFLSK